MGHEYVIKEWQCIGTDLLGEKIYEYVLVYETLSFLKCLLKFVYLHFYSTSGCLRFEDRS